MFTGKGGVGKTSCAVGCALAAAAEGRRPLVVEMGHRASLEGIFGSEGPASVDIGYTPREVGHGVHAMNLEFEASLVEYLEQNIKIKRVVRAITRNNALMRFFHAAPSVPEVTALNKLASLVEAREGGRPRWDPVIVDLDATGHALMLLNLPRVMDGLIGDGPMRGLIDGFSGLLSDPKRTVLNLVTLPRELPAQETLELFGTLDRDHKVPLGRLVVTQCPTPVFEDADADARAELAKAAEGGDFPAAQRAVIVAERAQARYARAQAQIAALREGVSLPTVAFEHRPQLELEGLQALGRAIIFEEAGHA